MPSPSTTTVTAQAPPTRSRRCLVILLWLAGAAPLQAQDMSTIALLLPRSGCALSAQETVRIRVVNLGSTLPGASIFSYAYTINGGVPVSETVFMGNPVPPNGLLTYSFITPADLSQPGTYQIDATITVSADANPANNALGAQPIQNWAPSLGGSLPAWPGTASAGLLSLAGQRGEVLEWQQSTDAERWSALSNTSTQQGFANLTQATHFRALVQNGPCAPALSSDTRVAPDPLFANGFES